MCRPLSPTGISRTSAQNTPSLHVSSAPRPPKPGGRASPLKPPPPLEPSSTALLPHHHRRTGSDPGVIRAGGSLRVFGSVMEAWRWVATLPPGRLNKPGGMKTSEYTKLGSPHQFFYILYQQLQKRGAHGSSASRPGDPRLQVVPGWKAAVQAIITTQCSSTDPCQRSCVA